MIKEGAALAGIVLAVGLHALGWRWRRRNPTGTTVAGLVAATLVTLGCVALLGPFTGELHVAAITTLVVFWGVALAAGRAHSRACRIAPWVAIGGQCLEIAFGLLVTLCGGKLVEILYYRGADDAPEWIVARTACVWGQLAFIGTLLLLLIARPTFGRPAAESAE